MEKRTLKDYALISLKGIGMGAADVVPGVSGGTIAFISGIYEELIFSIKSVNGAALKLLIQGKFQSFWKSVNGNFLLALFLGIGVSIFSLARVIKYLLDTQPVAVWSFFFGLIIASSWLVSKRITHWNWQVIVALILGTVFAFSITLLTPASTPDTLWFVFICGMIAICAMILPGVSGAFLLLMLGKYAFVLEALTTFNFLVIGVFSAGALIGILAFSNILSYLLKYYYQLTVAVLTGFMLGSLNKVWPWKEVVSTFTDRHGVSKPLVEKNVMPFTVEGEAHLLLAIIMAVVGFGLIYGLERFAFSKGKKD